VQGASSTGTLEEGPWEALPEELVLRVLDELEWTPRDSGAVRGSCRRWRAIHDAGRKTLRVRNGVTDEVMHALRGRLPALTFLDLRWVKSLTVEGLRAVGGLTALATLNLYNCPNVTDVGLRELRGLTSLTQLYLVHCRSVTDVGLQELTSLTALTYLNLYGCSTSKLGRDALKAAIPGLTISGRR
jgi:hypothetical protein